MNCHKNLSGREYAAQEAKTDVNPQGSYRVNWLEYIRSEKPPFRMKEEILKELKVPSLKQEMLR